MNLDLAIQNTLKRSPMENAMHGVVSNLGQNYELFSIPNTVKRAEDMMGQKIVLAHSNPLAKPVATAQPIPWIDKVHHADTMVPAPINMSSADVLRNNSQLKFGNPIGNQSIAPVNTQGINLLQRRKF